MLFDVYGTLLEIACPTKPFAKLLRIASDHGVDIDRKSSIALLSKPMTLAQAARHLDISLSKGESQMLARALSIELNSVQLFSEVPFVLKSLRRRGCRLGVCSNLASPYVAPARRLLEPFIDVAIWSCEVGLVKPDPDIYGLAIQRMGLSAEGVLMVGDNYNADVAGPIAAGMSAKLLKRRQTLAASENSLLTLREIL